MSDQPAKPHQRRVRYAGTHPKKFSEKYKELNPEKYQADIERVKQRGQTPAGSHRPILVREILEALELAPGQIGVDCTLGYGGHAREILSVIAPGGRLYGLDVDSAEQTKTVARLRAAGFDQPAFRPRHLNFANLSELLTEEPAGFDFILADLGVSSMQLDTPDRGFSWKNPAPLDLRLDPTDGPTAAQFLASLTEAEMIDVLIENADEPRAPLLAKALVRHKSACATTDGLARIVTETLTAAKVQPIEIKTSIQRVFQALRIAVNDEFEALDSLLTALPACLKSGGRVAFLTFHSGEDRRVKKAFKEFERTGLFVEAVRRPERASGQERHDNPRSSSAKLRWAVRA